MYVQALQIALSKNVDSVWHKLLEQAITKAEMLALVESQFEAKVNASKASRGEKPTKLSKSRRAEIDSFDVDAATLRVDLLAQYKSEFSARQIVATLKSGLDSDLKIWSSAAKHSHPDDLPTVQEFVNAKRELGESLAHCLAGCPSSAA
jgi:hypothetical protein